MNLSSFINNNIIITMSITFLLLSTKIAPTTARLTSASKSKSTTTSERKTQNINNSGSTVEQECKLKLTVSCHVQLESDHRECDQIQMEPSKCTKIPVKFGFRFCNMNKYNAISGVVGNMSINHGLAVSDEEGYHEHLPIDGRVLKPENCREFTKEHEVDSCANSFRADMTASGFLENGVSCDDSDKFVFLRPLFEAVN